MYIKSTLIKGVTSTS